MKHRDKDLEGRFRKDQEPLVRGRVGFILMMGVIFVPLFRLIDYLLFPKFFNTFALYRSLASGGCLVLYLVNRYADLGFKSFYLGVAGYYLVGFSIIKMILDLGGYTTSYYAGLNLVFIGFTVILPLDTRRTATHCILLYLIYTAALLLTKRPEHLALFLSNNSFVVSTLAIVIFAAYVNYQLRWKEYISRIHLEELRNQLKRYSEGLENVVEEKHKALMKNIEELHERQAMLVETQRAAIFGLAKLAESRDKETGEHLARMRCVCKAIAEELIFSDGYSDQMDRKFIEDLADSCALHDLGKVAVPDAVLLKPGPLTDEEYEVIQKHAAIGGDALKAIDERLGNESFIRIGQEIAYSHHERYDGTGYPTGLKGEEIPLAARIVAVADVYDALTSKRCYRAPVTPEEALDYIVRSRGRHFDPDVVDAFLRAYPRLRRETSPSGEDDCDEGGGKSAKPGE
ncbi:MAG: HD domain-containing protein [Deltaproteobacteria bacterium]|nr:HD domain-containing protein [Deltaproteobacteria bacterium]